MTNDSTKTVQLDLMFPEDADEWLEDVLPDGHGVTYEHVDTGKGWWETKLTGPADMIDRLVASYNAE